MKGSEHHDAVEAVSNLLGNRPTRHCRPPACLFELQKMLRLPTLSQTFH